MTTPTAETVQAQTALADGARRQGTAWRPNFSRAEIAFLIAVPLAWAVVLLFHGAPDPDDIYGSLRDEANRYVIVHLVSVPFLGLMGAALYLLLRDRAARRRRRTAASTRPQASRSNLASPGRPAHRRHQDVASECERRVIAFFDQTLLNGKPTGRSTP